MHTVTTNIRRKVAKYQTDTGTKAGVLCIYEHTGKLKTLTQLRHLSDQERDWFLDGFNQYISAKDHPAKDSHAPVHYGMIIFYLSLVYYLSLVIWLVLLNAYAAKHSLFLDWPAVQYWVIFNVALNLILTFYGVYLEYRALRRNLTTSQRWLSLGCVTVLTVTIIANLLIGLIINPSSIAYHMFFR